MSRSPGFVTKKPAADMVTKMLDDRLPFMRRSNFHLSSTDRTFFKIGVSELVRGWREAHQRTHDFSYLHDVKDLLASAQLFINAVDANKLNDEDGVLAVAATMREIIERRLAENSTRP
ncbi:MAG: hypothetical protein COY40_05740 [Alphaproteobacteria bacterium CG_4_10_14_0_8_um_filter_53_9]|nr:MAG: hypothetical protein COY40_05740 [Alphaproteobacteria bacterium CG_4_10_14_0_8_um_filter_53_9]